MPENKDPIYLDMKSQLALVEKSAHDAKAKIAEAKKDLSAAVPQTGQIAQAKKKLFQAEKLYDIYQQQVKYWQIRIEARAKQARIDYDASFKNKTAWPNQDEYASYMSEKRLRLAKIEWDSKQRLEDYKRELNPKSSGGHGDGHGGEAKKAAHGESSH